MLLNWIEKLNVNLCIEEVRIAIENVTCIIPESTTITSIITTICWTKLRWRHTSSWLKPVIRLIEIRRMLLKEMFISVSSLCMCKTIGSFNLEMSEQKIIDKFWMVFACNNLLNVKQMETYVLKWIMIRRMCAFFSVLYFLCVFYILSDYLTSHASFSLAHVNEFNSRACCFFLNSPHLTVYRHNNTRF